MELLDKTAGLAAIRATGFELPIDGDWSAWPVAWYGLPADSGAKTWLAHFIASKFAGSPAIFGINEHGIWPSSENEGLFARYRSAFSELRPIFERPYHLIQEVETEFLEGMFALSLYFIWGAVLVNKEGTMAARTSHDEWIEVACKEQSRLDEFREVLTYSLGAERSPGGKMVAPPTGPES